MPEDEVPSNVVPIDDPKPLTLEEKQAAMRERVAKGKRGNPLLKKGETPYNLHGNFNSWLSLNPSYVRKSRRSSEEICRRFLEEVVNVKGAVAQHSDVAHERLHRLLDALYRTAISVKNKNQVKAAELLMSYAYGKPKASDADLKAIAKGGLTMIYLNRPEIDPDIPVANPQLEAGAPEFIHGEVVDE